MNMPFWVEQILERVATYGYDAHPKPIREVYVSLDNVSSLEDIRASINVSGTIS